MASLMERAKLHFLVPTLFRFLARDMISELCAQRIHKVRMHAINGSMDGLQLSTCRHMTSGTLIHQFHRECMQFIDGTLVYIHEP